MNFTEKIRFTRSSEKASDYGTKTVKSVQKWEKFDHQIRVDSLNNPLARSSRGQTDPLNMIPMGQYVDTIVEKGLFKKTIHILAYDCDTFEDMVRATTDLFRKNMCHTVFESSPGRFWVITGMVGVFKDLYKTMELAAGVDREYVRHTRINKRFFLRAYPKNGYIPRVRARWRPEGSVVYSSDYALYNEWVSNFIHYLNSDCMTDVSSNLIRRIGAVVQGEVGDLMLHEGGASGAVLQWARKLGTEANSVSNSVETIEEVEMVTEVEDPIIEINNCLDCMEI